MNRLVLLICLACLPGCAIDGALAGLIGVDKAELKKAGKLLEGANAAGEAFAAKLNSNPASDFTAGDLFVPAEFPPSGQAASPDHPEDVLTIKVCQLRDDGVTTSCMSYKVVRKNWPSFWQKQGGAGTHLNGQPMRKFETLGVNRYSTNGDQISINIVPANGSQPVRGTCNCGCNGQCGGTCFCEDCTCGKAVSQQTGCTSCGSAGREGFMSRGPVRRIFAAPFRGGWFPGKRVAGFFKNGGLFRRGRCSGC